MSSGQTGNTILSGSQFTGSDFYKLWSGQDGRYEVLPDGTKRSKWNSYSVTIGSRQRSSNLWTCSPNNGSPDFPVLANVTFLMTKDAMPANLELTAQSRLANKVRGHSFNLAVNAAQGRQLVDMVVGNLGKLGRSIMALKHGDFSTAARQLGARPRTSRLKPSDISGRWLELQYGWLPTLSDTFEAAEAYEHLTKKPRVSTVRAGASDKISRNAFQGSVAQAIQNCRRRVNYVYEMVEDLTVARSLGLTDPLSVAWEVVPYSFVVDWFVPIGTYLDTLSILPILKGRCLTTKSWEWSGSEPLVYTGTLPGFFGGVFCKSVKYKGTDTCRAILVERSVSASVPSVKAPSFDAHGLHGTRIWNAIALAAQRFL